MFTGLIESVGEVVESAPINGGISLGLATSLAPELTLGESLAVNGVCLTVVRRDTATAWADVGPETLRVTTLGGLRPRMRVNLERSMRADSRFGGHFVQGHVDAVGTVVEVRSGSDFHTVRIAYPARFARSIIHRGSIAVDGISLTVAGLGADWFEVMIIPFTMAQDRKSTRLNSSHRT